MIQFTVLASTSTDIIRLAEYLEQTVGVKPKGIVKTEFTARKHLAEPVKAYAQYYDVVLSDLDFEDFAVFFNLTEEEAFRDFNAEVVV